MAYSLPAECAQELRKFGEVRDYEAGAVIFAEGDRGSCMYFVEQGEVALLFGHGKSKNLCPGECFGELALLSGHQRRTAGAIAAGPCRLRAVDQDAVDMLVETQPALIARLLRMTCGYLVASEQALVDDLKRRNAELERALDYLRRTREELDTAELASLTDALTGLYNRRCLDAQMPARIADARRSGDGFALVIVDLDHFKPINDTYGHMVGDLVLQQVSALFKRVVRREDLPCRLGGDEFALVLGGIDDETGLRRTRALLDAIRSEELVLPHARIPLSASVGGTALRPDDDWAALCRRADRNLYAAKEAGRGRVGWDGHDELPRVYEK